jgi:hypothetical protein
MNDQAAEYANDASNEHGKYDDCPADCEQDQQRLQ